MPLMHCVHYYSEKRNVFSDRPKTAAVYDGSRKLLGSEFQNIGPATDKGKKFEDMVSYFHAKHECVMIGRTY